MFDTAFHRSLPDAASVYPGPYEWLKLGIRRYRFHGASFRWATGQAARLLGPGPASQTRLIPCHLSGGCSLAATVGGKSVDTTMGLTPLDGVCMCKRSDSIDPGILLYLQRRGLDADKMEQTLSKESGLKGLSGDTRVIIPEARKNNQRARSAIEVFIHSLRARIGQMLAALGERPDAFVFTRAIGEPDIRTAVCQPFAFA